MQLLEIQLNTFIFTKSMPIFSCLRWAIFLSSARWHGSLCLTCVSCFYFLSHFSSLRGFSVYPHVRATAKVYDQIVTRVELLQNVKAVFLRCKLQWIKAQGETWVLSSRAPCVWLSLIHNSIIYRFVCYFLTPRFTKWRLLRRTRNKFIQILAAPLEKNNKTYGCKIIMYKAKTQSSKLWAKTMNKISQSSFCHIYS